MSSIRSSSPLLQIAHSSVEAVAQAANWRPRAAAAPRRSSAGVAAGRGIALGTHTSSYGAAVAEIEVDTRTGTIAVRHLYGALDAGLAVNPGFLENQITGMLVQAASRMLKEEVTFDNARVTSLDWASYPILRFAESPAVTPVVVQRLDDPSSGGGEEVLAAAAAAIANALFDATGVRLREYPLTPSRVMAALLTARGGDCMRKVAGIVLVVALAGRELAAQPAALPPLRDVIVAAIPGRHRGG